MRGASKSRHARQMRGDLTPMRDAGALGSRSTKASAPSWHMFPGLPRRHEAQRHASPWMFPGFVSRCQASPSRVTVRCQAIVGQCLALDVVPSPHCRRDLPTRKRHRPWSVSLATVLDRQCWAESQHQPSRTFRPLRCATTSTDLLVENHLFAMSKRLRIIRLCRSAWPGKDHDSKYFTLVDFVRRAGRHWLGGRSPDRESPEPTSLPRSDRSLAHGPRGLPPG